MKQATRVRLEPDQRATLDALSQQSGHTLAALIRWCIKNSLPVLEANIRKNASTTSK